MVRGDRIMSVYKCACNPLICIRNTLIDTCMLAFRWFVTYPRIVVTTYDFPAATNLVIAFTVLECVYGYVRKHGRARKVRA